MRALLLVLAACSGQRAADVPSNTAPPATAACPRDGINARLTIVTGRLPDGCTGGQFTVDGVVFGEYPVACAQVPTGRHVIGVESAGDCAGYMRCKLDLVVDTERVFDLRAPSCL